MKKTLGVISVLLACVSNAALTSEQINEKVSNGIESIGYQVDESFAITLNGLTATDTALFEIIIADNLKLDAQVSSNTVQFLNIGNVNNNSYAWNDASQYVITGKDSTNDLDVSFTLDYNALNQGMWITPSIAGNDTNGHTVTANGGQTVKTSNLSIYYDSEKQATVITATCNAQSRDYTSTTVINGLKLDANNIEVKYANADSVTVTIPEPTTATLSLLALAGLAARRRRR